MSGYGSNLGVNECAKEIFPKMRPWEREAAESPFHLSNNFTGRPTKNQSIYAGGKVCSLSRCI